MLAMKKAVNLLKQFEEIPIALFYLMKLKKRIQMYLIFFYKF